MTLASSVKHRITISVDAVGEATFTLTPDSGTPVVLHAGTFDTEPHRLALNFAYEATNSAGATPLVALHDFTSTCSIEVPELWTLTGSALELGPVAYDDDPEGNRRPTVFLGPGMDAPDFVAGDDMEPTRFAFPAPRPESIDAWLVTLDPTGTPVHLTLYSALPESELRAFFAGFSIPSTLDASFEAFRKKADGTYEWSMLECSP